MNPKVKALNRENNQLDSHINTENQPIVTDMICYIRGANISDYHQELVRQDLTEMVLSAQQRGETVEQVVGSDYRGFCDAVIASLPPKTKKQKILDRLDTVCWCLAILGAIQIVISKETIAIIEAVVLGNLVDFHMTVSVGNIVSIGLILIVAVVLVEVMTKHAFSVGNPKNRAVWAVVLGFGAVAVFLLIAWLGKQTLFTVNIFVAMFGVLALYGIHKILARL